jgi:hypothetical protein
VIAADGDEAGDLGLFVPGHHSFCAVFFSIEGFLIAAVVDGS